MMRKCNDVIIMSDIYLCYVINNPLSFILNAFKNIFYLIVSIFTTISGTFWEYFFITAKLDY